MGPPGSQSSDMSVLHSMKRIWRSDLDDNLKRQLFMATVESVLPFGAEAWTLTV